MNNRNIFEKISLKSALTIFLSCILFLMCASADVKKEKYDISKYSSKATDYERYLVQFDSYTTIGSIYHKKYENNLYGIARIFSSEKNYSVIEKTIGFYYDKKDNRKDRLFLGVDIRINQKDVSENEPYELNSKNVLKNDLIPSVEVLYSCPDILNEKDVKGIVIGYVWERGGRKELINIWIMKEDLISFYKNEITYNELVIRSVLTNTDGRIFRLAI